MLSVVSCVVVYRVRMLEILKLLKVICVSMIWLFKLYLSVYVEIWINDWILFFFLKKIKENKLVKGFVIYLYVY